MTNVQERGAAASLALPESALQTRLEQPGFGMFGNARAASGDAIRRTGPQYWLPPNPPPSGGLGGGASGLNPILSQLLNIVQQLLSMIGMGGTFNGLFGNAQGPEQYFQSASGTSTGDPHLSFNGSTQTGATDQTRFDSMTGHGDLLDSDSFAGGYQISTTVTQPAPSGVTFNQQAVVSTNFGDTQVALDKNGNATISQNGRTISLANGQSVFLGNGEMVSRAADGSVVIRDDNGAGGTISTTLSENGQGVDLNVEANDVDLGGDLLKQPTQLVWPQPFASRAAVQ